MNETPESKPDEILKDLENVFYMYRHDVVQGKINGKSGIVLEVAGDPDSDSSSTDNEDEEEDEEEEENDEEKEEEDNDSGIDEEGITVNKKNSDLHNRKKNPLPPDQVRVFWMDLSESCESMSDVSVVDRSFLPGNIVASASDPTGQVGVVIDVNLSVDLLTHDKSVIKDVSSKELKRVKNFIPGDHVVLGAWLGRVVDVLDNVTVRFDDGSVCIVTKADPLRLKPISRNILKDGHFVYYSGQRVKAVSSSVFKNSRWLCGSWRASRLEGTVINVSVGSVYIYWIASTGYGRDSLTTPNEEQSPKNLKLISCLTHANWQLGDWCLLSNHLLPSVFPNLSKSQLEDDSKVESIDTGKSSSLSVSKGTSHETWPLHRKKMRKVVIKREKKARKNEEKFERALLIVNSRTKVDIAWQNGEIERGREAKTLIPFDHQNDYEFVTEQYVVEKANDEDNNYVSETKRVGVVKSVNAKDRTACVRWIKPDMDRKEFDKEEVVSIYELEAHSDYDYVYADLVVRLSPEGSDYMSPDNAKLSDLPWVGTITGLKNGDVEVTWVDGNKSTVGPEEIYVVGRGDDDSIGDELSDDGASWETLEDDELLNFQNDKEESVKQNGSESEDNPGVNGALTIPLAAIGYMTRLASGIFSKGPTSEDGVDPTDEKRDSGDESDNLVTNGNREEHEIESALSSLKLEVTNSPSPSQCNDKERYSFKGFDITTDPSDHHFLASSTQNNGGRKWAKKIQQDWNILQNNLPDGIFVRVYEDRMDLLRAAIIGAYGTPYQDGLFFFDFHLPPDYPDVPPSAYYNSGGWKINPNLYEEGKVCLSLLNTWTGKGNEVWHPSVSSILQILVSLQGLVLNSKPYFNEAGYDKQVGTLEGEKNSLSYNENSFLLSCKTMLYLMRKPPKEFEELVKEHFKRRGHYILKACDAYMKGNLIGSLNEDASVSSNDTSISNSVGFKIMLVKIIPKLFLALSEIGADCDDFKHLQQV